MKIAYWLEYQKEIEINLSAEDISILFRESYSENPKDAQAMMLNNLNSIASFLISITNEVITGLSDKQQETISRFLKEQGQRFEPVPTICTCVDETEQCSHCQEIRHKP